MSPSTDLIRFALDHRAEPLDRLAFSLAKRPREEAQFVLQQVEGWQRLRTKVPRWASIDALLYPPKLSLEQCSGEDAAAYKASVVARLFADEHPQSMADLTGGLGVDFSFLAPLFQRATYVERYAPLCDIARHNFPLLDLPAAEVVNGDGVDFLREMRPVDLLMLDPARRDAAGQKTVSLADCEPDVTQLLALLREKSRFALIKLSPMLDIHLALRQLPQAVSEVHVVGAKGECKDLLLVVSREAVDTPIIYVAEADARFSFTFANEQAARPTYAAAPSAYLYEPGAAMMKAGAFALLATRFGLEKLHPNSHLYTSAERVEAFPGRTFAVERTFTFAKRDLAALKRLAPKANLAVRNFPESVANLRRRLGLKEGGEKYIFATTVGDEKLLILCRKA